MGAEKSIIAATPGLIADAVKLYFKPVLIILESFTGRGMVRMMSRLLPTHRSVQITPKVLVATTSAEFSAVLSNTLEEFGYNVVIARKNIELLERVQSELLDVVLVDMDFVAGRPITAFLEVKKKLDSKYLQVVLVTPWSRTKSKKYSAISKIIAPTPSALRERTSFLEVVRKAVSEHRKAVQ